MKNENSNPDLKNCISRYPQNLARNTGKSGCQTPFTMVPDTDMIPSKQMAEKLEVLYTLYRVDKVEPLCSVRFTLHVHTCTVEKLYVLYSVLQ